MKKLAAVLACAVFLCGCGRETTPRDSRPREAERAPKAEYHKISAAEAHKMMGELSGYILLDVRTDGEFKGRRIEGAMLIPDKELHARAEKELPDKNQVIFVYCRSGRRSANAAMELVALGYMNVYDFGGIIDWPYETVKG